MPTPTPTSAPLSHYELLSVCAYWTQAIAAVVTVIFVIKVYRKVLNQRIAESRLSLILNLIEIFQQNTYHFELRQRGFGGNKDNFSINTADITLFDLASLYPIENSSKFSIPVFMPHNYAVKFDRSPNTFISNPLLPSNIASGLIALKSCFSIIKEDTIDKSKYIMMGTEVAELTELGKDHHITTVFSIDGGLIKLVEISSDITKALTSWLKNNGIEVNQHVSSPNTIFETWKILD